MTIALKTWYPFAIKLQMAALSAQIEELYAAFSTLQPQTFSVSKAAPTWYFE